MSTQIVVRKGCERNLLIYGRPGWIRTSDQGIMSSRLVVTYLNGLGPTRRERRVTLTRGRGLELRLDGLDPTNVATLRLPRAPDHRDILCSGLRLPLLSHKGQGQA